MNKVELLKEFKETWPMIQRTRAELLEISEAMGPEHKERIEKLFSAEERNGGYRWRFQYMNYLFNTKETVALRVNKSTLEQQVTESEEVLGSLLKLQSELLESMWENHYGVGV